MQGIYKVAHPRKSSVFFLSMIDLYPGDNFCIYATIAYLGNHAKQYGKTDVITFDQRLWLKALQMQENSSRDC